MTNSTAVHSPALPPLPAVAYIGAGSMSGALLAGLVGSGLPVEGGIRATNRSAAKANALAGRHGSAVRALAAETDPRANEHAVEGAGIVVLGVKPYQVDEALDGLGSALEPGATVVSVAAGIDLDRLHAHLPETVTAARAMPNTPASVGAGVTGLAFDGRESAERRAEIVRLFETAGRVVVLADETRIDLVSAVSGSGPAYFFYVVEQLESAARELGFSEKDAATLVEGTFAGSARLLEASGRSPADLRVAVTSPGGTTEQALARLAEGGLANTFVQALRAAVARSAELARG